MAPSTNCNVSRESCALSFVVCVTVCCSELQYVADDLSRKSCCIVLQYVANCNLSRESCALPFVVCVAVCCSMLQCVAVCCR